MYVMAPRFEVISTITAKITIYFDVTMDSVVDC
jgi:hypothetical protein